MLIEEPDGTLIVVGVCVFCGQFSELRGVSKDAYSKWRSGMYIDDAFPGMPVAERETLVTGAHEKCYNKAFGCDDEFLTISETLRDLPGNVSYVDCERE
jgi:hypothetical protein